ncbi:MAG: lipocalin family protein [Defluviitaleaceae bacterium]|nr:lipocalin family protein [Defluviitaleaceae bacterium]
MKKLICVALLLALLPIFASCGGNGEHPVVGTWEAVSWELSYGGEMIDFGYINDVLQFFYDGTGVETWGSTDANFTWATENGSITLIFPHFEEVSEYEISGNTLTLTHYEEGYTSIAIFRRVD